MKYAVVYSSNTGNTALLSDRIRQCIAPEELCWYGGPSASAWNADILFTGFWTDKGSCDEEIAEFLRQTKGKKIFLFGTAGFGRDAEYYEQILSRVLIHMDASNQLIGSFMCQGKMQGSVRKRYEAMLEAGAKQARMLLDNYDTALSHPDEEDLKRLEIQVRELL